VWGNFRKKVILSIAGLFNFYTDLGNKQSFCTYVMFGPNLALRRVVLLRKAPSPFANVDKNTVSDWGWP
jgi:hypothetical protein